MPLALWLATGCNKQLELMSDAPNPGEIPPTDPHNMALFYQIGTEQADSLIKNNRDLLILDMRAPETYAAAHLRGAVNLPSSSDQLNAYLEPLDRKTKVFGYGDLNPETFNGILRVREMGFLDVFWLSFGYSSWVDAGKPVYDAEEKPVPKETAEALAEEEKKAAGL
ncbi:MAG: rhodanese-like domain-containing protein [Verrucomicrobiae bacterium]|nr:rhodanese-like domain-containing protein [Verrucomicrobiae bacterium]